MNNTGFDLNITCVKTIATAHEGTGNAAMQIIVGAAADLIVVSGVSGKQRKCPGVGVVRAFAVESADLR